MIKPLPHWVLTNNQPAFYDTESVTAIEMVAKIYGKMEELVNAYNDFVDEVNGHLTEQDKEIAEAVSYMTDQIVQTAETIFYEFLNEGKIYVSLAEDYDETNESLTLGIGVNTSDQLVEDLSELATPTEGDGE